MEELLKRVTIFIYELNQYGSNLLDVIQVRSLNVFTPETVLVVS